MIITLETQEGLKHANLDKPICISIPLKDGPHNPNCYWAEDPKFETIVQDDFIGNVSNGGSVNYKKVSITPHGNGTHTECLGHITQEEESINTAPPPADQRIQRHVQRNPRGQYWRHR